MQVSNNKSLVAPDEMQRGSIRRLLGLTGMAGVRSGARPCHRSDRRNTTSGVGTFETYRTLPRMSAFRGKAEVARTSPKPSLLTTDISHYRQNSFLKGIQEWEGAM